MSEIQVNKIVPESGTDVTLGDSGDTFTIPSGAIITNSGTANGFGKLGQVLQVVKTDTFTTSSSSWTDITDLTLAITPTATDSKILIQASVNNGGISNFYGAIRFDRGGTTIAVGDAAGSRLQSTMSVGNIVTGGNYKQYVCTMSYLDSPSTTSATTYKLQMYSGDANAGYINRTYTDSDADWQDRPISTLTLMEVLA